LEGRGDSTVYSYTIKRYTVARPSVETVLMDTPGGPQPFPMPARLCTLERQ
jgi:hypothetical protein